MHLSSNFVKSRSPGHAKTLPCLYIMMLTNLLFLGHSKEVGQVCRVHDLEPQGHITSLSQISLYKGQV